MGSLAPSPHPGAGGKQHRMNFLDPVVLPWEAGHTELRLQSKAKLV